MNDELGLEMEDAQIATSPDLRTYDFCTYSFIMFDSVSDMKFVLGQGALFQANADVHMLGENKTGMYSYDVCLFKLPVIETVDMSATRDPQEVWIKQNCFDVMFSGPSWLK